MSKVKRIDKLLRARVKMQYIIKNFDLSRKGSLQEFMSICEKSAKYNTYLHRETARVKQIDYGEYLKKVGNRSK